MAHKEGDVVGTVSFQIVPNLSHDDRPWAILENMVVNDKCRRQGFGRLLIEYVVGRCREAGCYKLQLLSNKKGGEAHEFYRSVGFEDSALGFRAYL